MFFKWWHCDGENLKQGNTGIGGMGYSMKSIREFLIENITFEQNSMSQALGAVFQTEVWPSCLKNSKETSVALAKWITARVEEDQIRQIGARNKKHGSIM